MKLNKKQKKNSNETSLAARNVRKQPKWGNRTEVKKKESNCIIHLNKSAF